MHSLTHPGSLAALLVALTLTFPLSAEEIPCPCGESPGAEPASEKKEGRKTLFQWPGVKDAEDDFRCELCWDPEGNGGRQSADGDEEEDTIVTDRPDFTEASSTVGRGRIQLEAGYTYFNDNTNGTRTISHSFPEALFRIGLFADWFELRLFQNFGNEGVRTGGVLAQGNGAEDFSIGAKIWLAEQAGVLPETALILQMAVPTGSGAFTANEVLPGANLLYSWNVIEDCISIGGSTQANRALDDANDFYAEVAQSLTVAYTLSEKLGAYTECFAFFPIAATDAGPEYFFNGGFTYLVTNNFQLDIRAGVGLNDRAADFFAGTGFSVRY